ncbi:hypothetical protein TNIN_166491 [Trichonephila inaurata madagascariensis]|uniref:Uncharacterized protein n=1 Tax=Trichonephila inaurata madagascariensis TaxID=2747483 RepID=A0A8X6YAY6_9ARAC|nr:hypothetical protein TNIN_166491 [Trichonephila inaurata madagascariensis]
MSLRILGRRNSNYSCYEEYGASRQILKGTAPAVIEDGRKEFKKNFQQPQAISKTKLKDNINQNGTLPVPQGLSNKEKAINYRDIKYNSKLFPQVIRNSDSLKTETIPGESSSPNELNRRKLRKVTANDAEFVVEDSTEHIIKKYLAEQNT